MATDKVQIPSDTGNTGKKIGHETQVIGPDTLYMQRFVQTDKTLDQTQAVTAKGVQGAYAASVQNLKDSGRVIFTVASAIAGVTCVTTEALLTMIPSRDAVVAGTATTHPVTAGKRLRIETMVCGCISTSAAVLSGRVSLRYIATGSVVAASPIITTCPMSVPAALAQMGDWCVVPLPDGLELSGTMQFGITQIFSAVTGLVWASVIGYEY